MLRIPLTKTDAATLFPTRLLDALGYNGYEAVFIFFVISGYLITDNALRRYGDLGKIDKRAFYVRRLARIAPCLVVLVLVLSMFHVLQIANFTINRPGQSLLQAISSALLLYLNWYEGKTGYLPAAWDVLWSLSIEEAFYLVFPIVCLVARWRSWLLTLALLLLALSLPVSRRLLEANEIWQEKAYLPGMAAIATGVLTAQIGAQAASLGSRTLQLLGCYGVFGLFSILFFEDDLWRLLDNGTMLILTSASAALLLAFRSGWSAPWIARGSSWIQSFGRLSYEIYLSHVFALFAVLALFHALGSDMPSGWIWFIPSLMLSWGLGWLIDRALSTPANRWIRDKLARRSAIGGSVRGAITVNRL